LSGQELAVISLFSGIGGLDLGLQAAGFTVRFLIDSDHCCCETLRLNKRRYWKESVIIEDDVRNWSGAEMLEAAGLKAGEVALVTGGSPCQPFSKSAFWSPLRWKDGRRTRPGPHTHRSAEQFQGLQDSRAELLREFVRVVQEVRPVAYVMENVPGLAYRTSRPMLESVLQGLRSAGYTVSYRVLNAADYGVPQKRERLFIIGARSRVELAFPRPTHCSRSMLSAHPDLKPHVTAGEAIGDLDDGTVKDDERVGGKWGHLLPLIPPGSNYLALTKERGHPSPIFRWRSRYWSFLLKLSPDMPAWTIQARPSPYTGPFHWRNRRLRIEEIKRLQTFPDDYQIYGSRREAQRQLGDAVPPLLAQRIGEAIRRQLSEAGLI
jgi:DNA (cytosine-5)-methyltransferase 1